MTDQDVVQKSTEVEAPAEAPVATEAPAPVGTPVNIKMETPVKVETITEEEASYPSPRGAFMFVMILLVFYALYWTLAYFEIFVLRGA